MLLKLIQTIFLNLQLKKQIEKKYKIKVKPLYIYAVKNYLISIGVFNQENIKTDILLYILNNGLVISTARELLLKELNNKYQQS